MMRFVGIFVLLCAFMAAARMAIVIMTLFFLLSLLWAAINRPERAFGFLAMLALVKLAEVYPATLIIVLVIALIYSADTKFKD